MSDINEPDESDVDFELGEEVTRKLEVEMLTAIANDFEAMTGEFVSVTSYLVVANVVNTDGTPDTMWTTTDDMSPHAMLGLAHWLLKRVDEVT